jgi:hypothetical protein
MRAHEYTGAPCDARPRFRQLTNHKPRFIPDWRGHCRPIDRNERAKIMFLAEALERRTKPKGRRNGQLGYVGLRVLKALLFGFLSLATGRLDPSYAAMGERTGLCHQSVANGLARLERTGIIRIAARLAKQRIDRVSAITGLRERFWQTVQATNLYSIHRPGAWADHLPRPPARKTRFPSAELMRSLLQGDLLWHTNLSIDRPSPRDREKPPTPGASILADHDWQG